MGDILVVAAFPQDAAKIIQVKQENKEVVQEWMCWGSEIVSTIEGILPRVNLECIRFIGPHSYVRKFAEELKEKTDVDIFVGA